MLGWPPEEALEMVAGPRASGGLAGASVWHGQQTCFFCAGNELSSTCLGQLFPQVARD